MLNQKGISHILVLVAIISIAVVSFAGWRVYDAQNSNSNDANVADQQVNQSDVIKDSKDVAELEGQLESNDIDSELNESALDEDLNELQ